MKAEYLTEEIKRLKAEKNAVILAHYYQEDEIQALADFVGDSLALAQKASELKAPLIVMCGVIFMAETVKLLCPNSKVLLLDQRSDCFLADSCQYEALKAEKEKYPDHLVVSYVNTSTLVKTLTDIVVTSSNAVKIVQNIPANQPILFGPDKNLGRYIKTLTGRENMRIWNGSCFIHDQADIDELMVLKKKYPNAVVLAHPECNEKVVENADFVGSTKALIEYVQNADNQQFIVSTEPGVIYQMKQSKPDAQYFPIVGYCEYMRLNTLEKLYSTLLNEEFEVTLDADIAKMALKPIEKMLEMS